MIDILLQQFVRSTFSQAHVFSATAATTAAKKDNSAYALIILIVPVLFALFNIVMAYLGGIKYQKLRKVSKQHEWLLQQKNNSLAVIQYKVGHPLSLITQKIEELYKAENLSTDNRKKLLNSVETSKSRIENLSRELQRSTLSLTQESVDIVPFYRSATTLLVISATAFMLVVIDSILVSTENLVLSFNTISTQVVALLTVVIAVLLTNRYKRISDKLLVHSKATLRLQESVDDAKDHIVSLVVKIIAADIEKLKADVALLVDHDDQAEITQNIARIDGVIGRLQMLNDIESRLIKSDVKLLNIEELIEDVFRTYQKQLNDRGLQVEHFHRVGASKIQLGVVQDRSLLKTALSEIFHNAVVNAPEQSVIKIVSEHNVSSSSITVSDQGSGEPFAHSSAHPMLSSDNESDSIGIGLYLADQIMHILGGELMVINTKGVGNSVKITFINNYVK